MDVIYMYTSACICVHDVHGSKSVLYILSLSFLNNIIPFKNTWM